MRFRSQAHLEGGFRCQAAIGYAAAPSSRLENIRIASRIASPPMAAPTSCSTC
jgi:hypothetical protein